MIAASTGNWPIVRYLLSDPEVRDRVDVDAPNRANQSPLLLAVYAGHM